MQLKPILNPNPEFGAWAGGVPSGWTLFPANGSIIQLNRHDPRDHPQRAVFPKQMKSSAYVFKGENSFRFTDAGAAAGTITVQSPQLPIRPGQFVSLGVAYRYTGVSVLKLDGFLFDAVGGLLTYTVFQIDAAGAEKYLPPDVPDPERNIPGNPNTVFFDPGGAKNISLLNAAADLPDGGQTIWARYGVSFKVPMGIRGIALGIVAGFVGNAGASLDLGELKLELQDGTTHPGG